MSIQDIAFLIVAVLLLIKSKYEWLVYAGLFCLILSILLFHFWVFFTAQRLTYYAVAFFVCAIIISLIKDKGEKTE